LNSVEIEKGVNSDKMSSRQTKTAPRTRHEQKPNGHDSGTDFAKVLLETEPAPEAVVLGRILLPLLAV
jgi:hypothetical protein